METNEVIPTDNLCRTCMLESPNMRSLFYSVNNNNKSLCEVLTFVTNMSVKLEDKLPNHMCSDCESLMTLSNIFKSKCLETEAKFLALLKLDTKATETEESVVKTESTDWNLLVTKPYQCSTCSLKFANLSDLEIHVLEKKRDLNVTKLESKIEVESSSYENEKTNFDAVKEEIPDNTIYSEDDLFTNDFDNEIFQNSNDLDKCEDLKSINKYQCSFCDMIFDDKSDYEKHIDDTSCCTNIIKTEITKSKKKSKAKINKTKQLTCEICIVKFNTLDSYKRHKKQMHGNKLLEEIKKYECSHCMRKFVKKTTLVSHMKRHENPASSHTCLICKREFIHRAHLDNHILSVHTTQDGFKCDYCPKNFTTKESLELHKDIHNNEKRHKCKFCSKAFNMLSTLRDHLRVHTGEKPFLCPTCGKGFSQNTNLQEHLRRHQGIKPFKCEMCERRFVSKGELSAHTRKHSGAHPFVCTDCGGAFTTSSSLVKHRRTHTGERPYQCDLCDMKFAASGTLKNHRRTHTGEKPYRCAHCDKAFVQKNDLVAHTRCHTGERPYVCSTCGQAFRQGSALKTHLKMHSSKDGLPLRKDLLSLMPGLNGV